MTTTETLTCLDGPEGCSGSVQYRVTPGRFALVGDHKSFPRCERHYEAAAKRDEETMRRYPPTPPRGWSPLDAGESWDEEGW